MGVAYGIKRDVVKFCDVLVAKQIAVCNDGPGAEKGGIDTQGGSTVDTKAILQNMFCNNFIGWNFPCTKANRLAKVVPGLLVSGPLQRMKENAIGGEMEGWVLYTNIINETPQFGGDYHQGGC